MKLHSDAAGAGGHRITAYGAGFVAVDETVFTGAILLSWGALETDIGVRRPDDLSASTITRLGAHDPEVVILGTGARHVFPPRELFAPLARAGIGVEIMSTPAACRTYNILDSEGRKVAALLLPIDEGTR